MNKVYIILILFANNCIWLYGQNVFTFDKGNNIIIHNFPYNGNNFKETISYNSSHIYLNKYNFIQIEISHSIDTIDICGRSNKNIINSQDVFEEDMKMKGFEIVSNSDCINKWNRNTYTVYGKGIIKEKYFCNLKKYISTPKGIIFIEIYQEAVSILEFIEMYKNIEIEII